MTPGTSDHAFAPVMVTGGSGFIGRAVLSRLRAAGVDVSCLGRRPISGFAGKFVESDLCVPESYRGHLAGVGTVLHLAGQAPVSGQSKAQLDAAMWRINVDATRQLALNAADAGVRHFIYLSSISVYGSFESGCPLDESSNVNPQSTYARSKLAAEEALRRVEKSTGMTVTIIRPPAVYGEGCTSVLARILRAGAAGIPLPLAGFNQPCSMVSAGNLADFVVRCMARPASGGQTFVVADAEAVSIPEMIRILARFSGNHARLFHVPWPVMLLGGALLRKRATVVALRQSIVLDIGKARSSLDWTPPFTLNDELGKMARSFGGNAKAG